jgi:hypothetical protein
MDMIYSGLSPNCLVSSLLRESATDGISIVKWYNHGNRIATTKPDISIENLPDFSTNSVLELGFQCEKQIGCVANQEWCLATWDQSPYTVSMKSRIRALAVSSGIRPSELNVFSFM